MTRPDLPPTRDERIALARATIADLLVTDEGDQMDAEPVASLENPAQVTFRVQVTDEPRGWELCVDVSEALLNAAFRAVWFGDLEYVDGAVRVAIHVQVGAPADEAVVDDPDAPKSCPHGNMPRDAGAGHWRDWHRGHGCHLDPSRNPVSS